MATPLMGQYGPEAVLDQNGNPQTSAPVTVYLMNGTSAAALYTDQTGGSSQANPGLTTDNNGNLTFYAPVGEYIVSIIINGIVTTFQVSCDVYPTADSQLYWTGAALQGSVPSPAVFFEQNWQVTVTTGSNGLATGISLPVAFPNAFCSLFVMGLAVSAGSGTQYLIQGYNYSTWTLSTFAISAVEIDLTQSGTIALGRANADTIRCCFRALGC